MKSQFLNFQTDKKPFCSARTGFTLIETLVAVALVIGAMVGPIALITQTLFSAPFSRNDLVAYNLAQEGVELRRAIRDDLILCATFGTVDASSLGSLASGYFEFDALNTTTITCGTGPGAKTFSGVPKPTRRTSAATCNTVLRLTVVGQYTYMPSGVTPTNFTRCVRVCTPASASPCLGTPDGGGIPASDQTDVISTVSWTERGRQKSYTLRDRLYNWK